MLSASSPLLFVIYVHRPVSQGIGADFGSFLMDLDGIIGLGGDDTITDEEDFMHEDEVPVDEGKKKKKSKSLREEGPEAESAEEQPRKKSKKSIEDNAADTKKSSAAVVDTAPAVAAQGTYVPPSKRMIQGSSTTPSSSNAKMANKNEVRAATTLSLSLSPSQSIQPSYHVAMEHHRPSRKRPCEN